ncbi:MAG: hypothetical protein WCP98_09515 [Actinomycetes bacterium]
MRSLRLALAGLLAALGASLVGAAPALADVARPPLEDPRNVALLVLTGLAVLAVVAVAVLVLWRLSRRRPPPGGAGRRPEGPGAE